VESRIAQAVQEKLDNCLHVKEFALRAVPIGGEVEIQGVVRTFYQKQMAGVAALEVLRELGQVEFRLRNEVRVEAW